MGFFSIVSATCFRIKSVSARCASLSTYTAFAICQELSPSGRMSVADPSD